MRQRAEAENTTHELMATSVIKRWPRSNGTQRRNKRNGSPKSGAAKMRAAQAHRPALLTDQSGKRTEQSANPFTQTQPIRLHKHEDKSLKAFR